MVILGYGLNERTKRVRKDNENPLKGIISPCFTNFIHLKNPLSVIGLTLALGLIINHFIIYGIFKFKFKHINWHSEGFEQFRSILLAD
jgi:hypothetical protein